MNKLFAIIASILFVLLTPGTVLNLPKRASKFTRLALHTFIFGILLIIIAKVIRRFFGKSIENFQEELTMSTTGPNCSKSTGFTDGLGDALKSKGLDQTNMKNIITSYLQKESKKICNKKDDPENWKTKFPLDNDNNLDIALLQKKIINETTATNFMEQVQKFVNACNINVPNESDKLTIKDLEKDSSIKGILAKYEKKSDETKASTTNAPTTKAPTTNAPTTKAPTTKAPTTKAPESKATTKAPESKATTKAPESKATTKAPKK